MKHFTLFRKSLLMLVGLLLLGGGSAFADYDLSQYKQTGEDINVSTTQDPTTNFSTTTVSTGITETDLVYCAENTEGKIVPAREASDGWFNKDSKLAGYANNSAFFVQEVVSGKYDNLNVGQFPNAFASGGSQTVTIYLIKESTNSFYKVNITLNVNKPAALPTLAEMTQEGETKDLTIEEVLGDTKAYNLPTGITGTELQYCALDANGNLVNALNDGTNNYDGWFNKDGKLCLWGSDGFSMFIHKGGDYPTSFDVGMNNGYFTAVGQTQTVTVYLVNATEKKYYKVNVTLKVKEPDVIDLNSYKLLEEKNLEASQDPTTEYEAITIQTGLDDTNFKYYGYNKSDKLVMNSTDGWFNKEGKMANYNDNSGICVKTNDNNSTLTICQFPNAFKFGGSPTVTIYLLNNTSKTYYKLNVTLHVNAPKQTVTITDAKYATIVANEALDFTDSGLKAFAVNYSNNNVTYTEVTKASKGAALLVYGAETKDYNVTELETADAITTSLQAATADVTADGTQYVLANGEDGLGWYPVEKGETIPTGKGYLVIATGAKPFYAINSGVTAIKTISNNVDNENAPVYNLAGQRVGKDYKGVVIVNGKKVIRK